MKTVKTVCVSKETTNEYGVKIVDTVYCETTTLSSGAVYNKRYSWVHEVGGTKMLWYETKQLARMQREMAKRGF